MQPQYGNRLIHYILPVPNLDHISSLSPLIIIPLRTSHNCTSHHTSSLNPRRSEP